MEMDINKMFQDKNKEIFINSLTLEMERNLEALKFTTDNCVALEINKLILFFKNYFKEEKIKYKKEELITLLYDEKNKINELVNSKIEEKKKSIKEDFLNKSVEEDVITEEFLNNYYKMITSKTEQLNEELDVLLKTEICIDFVSEIIKKYKLTTDEQEERIHSRINGLFKDTIIRRVKEEIMFRDESLKNMCFESYEKYLEQLKGDFV